MGPRRTIVNSVGAHAIEHRCRIPIRARVDRAETGEQWIDTTALKWAGDMVYIDTSGTGHGFNAR